MTAQLFGNILKKIVTCYPNSLILALIGKFILLIDGRYNLPI